MDRPSALDLAFLDLETSQAPLHVGWTLRFAGPPPSLAALRRHLEARLHAVPRFRRRLVRPTLDAPHWADDPRFDVAHHVFAVTLPGPRGPAQLRETAGLLLSQPLPMHRPLWRIYLVQGLHGDGFALVGQAHHALVDGIAAIDVALLLFGAAAPGSQPTWVPERGPSTRTAAQATARARAGAAVSAARSLSGALGGGIGGTLREGARAIDALARPVPVTALDRSVTAERALAFADVPLAAVREAARPCGATINDVLLAACTMALRTTLRRRDERPEVLRALVPVNVRGEVAGALGNRVSFLGVDLPVGERDPHRILGAIRERTAEAKARGEAATLDAVAAAADALPGAARRIVARAVARGLNFNLAISNVPGPPTELTLLGRPLLAVYPMVPLLHGHALTIGAVSYRERLHLGLAADAAVLPDVVDTGRELEAAFDALRLAARSGSPRPTPWGTQARARRQRATNR